jgi:hypothetical protein
LLEYLWERETRQYLFPAILIFISGRLRLCAGFHAGQAKYRDFPPAQPPANPQMVYPSRFPLLAAEYPGRGVYFSLVPIGVIELDFFHIPVNFS